MTTSVSEFKEGNATCFVVEEKDEAGKTISKREICIRLRSIQVQGQTRYLLYDENMKVIPGTWGYLNDHIALKAPNTRKQRAYSLRQLYSFIGIIRTSLDQFTASEIMQYRQFLKGLNTKSSIDSRTILRDNSTINMHLETMRDYVSYLHLENSCFRESVSSRILLPSEYSAEPFEKEVSKSAFSMPEYKGDGIAPRYISEDEYVRLRQLATAKGDAAGELLFDLMYLDGLRPGEALSLTLEDIKEDIMNGEYIFYIILRNRISDKDFQSSKNLPHPETPFEYRRKDYDRSAPRIVLDEHTYEQILRYIDDVHGSLKNKPDIYAASLADKVGDEDFESEENHYLLLNKWGRPLSGQAWSKRLREYFKECGLSVDTGVRKNNLSHRFRHGFAMHQLKNGIDPIDVQKMMRHRSISSILIYHNPTVEEEMEMKKAFQNSLKEDIQRGTKA